MFFEDKTDEVRRLYNRRDNVKHTKLLWASWSRANKLIQRWILLRMHVQRLAVVLASLSFSKLNLPLFRSIFKQLNVGHSRTILPNVVHLDDNKDRCFGHFFFGPYIDKNLCRCIGFHQVFPCPCPSVRHPFLPSVPLGAGLGSLQKRLIVVVCIYVLCGDTRTIKGKCQAASV